MEASKPYGERYGELPLPKLRDSFETMKHQSAENITNLAVLVLEQHKMAPAIESQLQRYTEFKTAGNADLGRWIDDIVLAIDNEIKIGEAKREVAFKEMLKKVQDKVKVMRYLIDMKSAAKTFSVSLSFIADEHSKIANLYSFTYPTKYQSVMEHIGKAKGFQQKSMNFVTIGLVEKIKLWLNDVDEAIKNVERAAQYANNPDEVMANYGGAPQKHKYKGKSYKVRTGKRGGKYITVNDKKIYI